MKETELLYENEEYFERWKTWFLNTCEEHGPANEITIRKWITSFYNYNVKNLYSRTKRLRKKLRGVGITKYRLFLIYGKEEGTKRWESYCDKQAYSNSKEYKGMTDEQFSEYNKSRAVTKENLIKKHGKNEGMRIWNSYVERQRYTKSKQRYIDDFGVNGEIIFNNINKSKAVSLKSLIKKHGEEEGKRIFEKWINKKSSFHSNEASTFFFKLQEKIGKDCYFEPETKEMVLYNKELDCAFFYDFYCKEDGIVIEYNGSIFHANPNLYSEEDKPNPWFREMTAKQIWKRDNAKMMTAAEKGYRYFVVWDTFAKENEQAVNVVYSFIMNNEEKYVEFI